MKIGQKIGERSVEIIKSSEFTEYLAEKVHQTNDPDETSMILAQEALKILHEGNHR